MSVFRMSGEPWFRMGRVEVTSTMLVVLVGLAGMLATVIAPASMAMLAYVPRDLVHGYVWQLFTWPVPMGSNVLWTMLMLFLLWYFGTDLESQVGRNKMLRLYLGIWGSLTIAATAVGLLLPGVGLAGLGQVEFAILLLWIAEYPTRPFFFGIRAWVIGAILVAAEVLQYVMYRAWGHLLIFVLGFLGVAVVARGVGLLSDYPWIPGARRRPAKRRPPRPTREERTAAHVENRIDELLDKISREGIHSLTTADRKELEKLRQQRRRPSS